MCGGLGRLTPRPVPGRSRHQAPCGDASSSGWAPAVGFLVLEDSLERSVTGSGLVHLSEVRHREPDEPQSGRGRPEISVQVPPRRSPLSAICGRWRGWWSDVPVAAPGRSSLATGEGGGHLAVCPGWGTTWLALHQLLAASTLGITARRCGLARAGRRSRGPTSVKRVAPPLGRQRVGPHAVADAPLLGRRVERGVLGHDPRSRV